MSRLLPLAILLSAAVLVAGSGCVPYWVYYNTAKTNEAYVLQIEGHQKEHADLARRTKTAESESGRFEIENKKLKEQIEKLEPQFEDAVKKLKEALKGGIQKVGFTPAESQDVQITDDGKISIAGDVLFDLGKASLTQKAKDILGKLAPILKENTQSAYLRIEGHTDDVPIKNPATLKNYPTNWHLSAARALSVLVELRKLGIPEKRMYSAGYGEFEPRVGNAPGHKGAKKNRRVEIAIVSSK